MSNISPMMEQYLDIKSMHQDCVLFFRLGDFYEMFFDDAINISKELELTLTGRDCGMPEKAPMCGIPYHSSEIYIKRLIEKGYKVAVCEQVEAHSPGQKGIVKREVIRIVTAGTVIESNLLSEEKNNYLAFVYLKNDCFSVCFADISTGEVQITQKNNIENIAFEIISELSKFCPTEVLINEDIIKHNLILEFLKNKLGCIYEVISDNAISLEYCTKNITEHFKKSDLTDLDLKNEDMKIIVLGGLLSYLNKIQKDGAARILGINIYSDDNYMSIDVNTRRNLELTQTIRIGEKKGTLLYVLDQTKTAMGKRFMRHSIEQPLCNIDEIKKRQKSIEELIKNYDVLSQLTHLLNDVYDLERLMTRVIYGSVSPRELKSLSFTISKIPKIKDIIGSLSTNYIFEIFTNIESLDEVHNLIENTIIDEPPASIKDGGVIKKGFNDELDEYKELAFKAKEIMTKIEEDERIKTGINKLKIGYNRVFGYYIEVTNSNKDLVPNTYIRKQTLSNCERYITQELKDIETKILSANERILSIEIEVFEEIRKYVATKISSIQNTAHAIAQLDFLTSLANVANANNYVCPTICHDGEINIINGRHPVVETLLPSNLFVPNDTLLDIKDNKMMIITGPNMAGKSTYMRQVALISIMAHIGSFVPADSAKISISDKIFTRVGASDDLSSGKSTFMVEMSEVANILSNATKKSLVILDEIGRGTSTFDGMSIAKAVISYIITNDKLGFKTLFATHYHELTVIEKELQGVKNYNIVAKKKEDGIVFLRKIVAGGSDDSYGIEVAKLAGIPDEVIKNANDILKELESNIPQKHQKQIINSIKDNEKSFENRLSEKVKGVNVDTLTPIEALNLLFELKKMI